MTDAPGPGHNDPSIALLKQVHALGEAKARGHDTMVQFGILMANAAYDGKIDLTKHKHGTNTDDAVKFYAEFEKGRSKAAIFDPKSASGKVQAAKGRTMIKLGGSSRFGTGEPIGTMNTLLGMYNKLRADPIHRGKLDDAYATLLRWARVQLKLHAVIEDKETLRAFCFRVEGKERTTLDYVAATLKRLDDLRAGKVDSLPQHSSANIITAISALRAECEALKAEDE